MPKKPKRGNIIAQAPIMRKGGVHEKSKSAKRQSSKRKLRKEVNNYMVADDGGERPYLASILHQIYYISHFSKECFA